MNGRNDTTSRLLPKKAAPDADRDAAPATPTNRMKRLNAVLAAATAFVLALALLPRLTHLAPGDVSPRDVVASFPMTVTYAGPDGGPATAQINKGELIVEAGKRATEKAAAAVSLMASREAFGRTISAYAGLFVIVGLILYLFYRDVRRYRPSLLGDTRKILLLLFLLLMTVVVSQVFRGIYLLLAESYKLDSATVGFALPVASGAMLVSLLLDFHLALAFSFVVSLLLGLLFPGDPFMPFYYFTGGITAALYVIRCKKRTVVIRAAVMTAVVGFISIVGIDLYRGELLSRLFYDAGAGFLGAAVTAAIVSVTLPFFEAIFDIATDIKLLELLDPNQPLLKELVYKSPGTYHHSIILGNLAEAAAEAIGENPLLARVGAYYHDIGKVQKPEYFIENQRQEENKHDRLSPSMSSLIIIAHVKEGVEMAKRQKLPSAIIDIIRQHHGSSLITYFYQKAKELQPLAVLSDQDYRYPGPRPRTKTAAIVMLADAVEAASRTLSEPTPHRIQGLVNSVITRIFLDDQLSMCDLTLKDLREIAKSFNLVLNGIFHHRIDYPGFEFSGPKKSSDHPDKKHAEEARPVRAVRSETA